MSVGNFYLQLVEDIRTLAKKNGRDPADISLVSVTKGYSLEHVIPAYEVGAKIFGENRVQEALLKKEKAPRDIEWHLIGTLQKNKVRKAVGEFSLIHSVDSPDLAEKISEVSLEMNVVTPVLLQANISEEESKHGLLPTQWERVFDSVLELPGVAIQGMMTMAPNVKDESVIHSNFQGLRELRDRLQRMAGDHCQLKHLSMGMSHDYPIAVAEGATLLRIGTAIFGHAL